jgi:transposase
MATERLSMRKTREILRLKWVLGKSHRDTARSLGVSAGAVAGAVGRAGHAGLCWAQIEALSDDELEARLYGAPGPASRQRSMPDLAQIHIELRKPGVTLELLHIEYLQKHPDGYRYTRFCELYREWCKRRRLSMRQVHRAGEKLFVDYSGKKPCIIDPKTGEVHEVELFVAVLGASNYTYAEATRTQKSSDWIASHIRALEFLGGVPGALVPDQLKSGVSKSCRYEPDVHRTYAELAAHYDTAIIPARPRKPRDKAKVEVAVQVVQRWILARLRKEQFFSLYALNQRIAELLAELNSRPMRTYGGVSRRDLFERLDRPALRPLPVERYVYGTWKAARVNIDYHIDVARHYYSVPYALAHELVEARVSATTVEIFHKGKRVASHPRRDEPGRHTTNPEHMPKSHQKHLEWTPSRLLRWASAIGPNVEALVNAILDERRHPEQGYRSCLGILRLQKRYGDERLDAACQRALRVRARSYRHVDSILKHGLDRTPVPGDEPAERSPVEHDNVRGPDYYH